MKNKLILAAICFLLATSCKKSNDGVTPQEQVTVISASSVPVVVITAFNNSFPGSTEVEWRSVNISGRTEKNEFEVEFNHQSQRHSSRFDDNGVSKKHNITCTSGTVPAVVLAAFRATHPTEVVTEWKLRNDGTWKAHYLKNTVLWEATYTVAGVLVKDEIA
jgi:hypothetical protein